MNLENIIINNSNMDGKELVRPTSQSNTSQVNKIWNQFQLDSKLQSVLNVSVQKQYRALNKKHYVKEN